MTKTTIILVVICTFCAATATLGAIDPGGIQWSVQYMIDQSQTVLGQDQFNAPRDNRGLAVSPDGHYLYAGYNNGPEVRKIDLTKTDYTEATVARTTVNRGKSIAVDDQGRVYLAEAGSIKVMDADLTTVQYTISGAGLITNCEGVAVTRENGALVLYNTERGGVSTLSRWVLTESGGQITGAVKSGLGGSGVMAIAGSLDMRGVAIDPLGRVWMADPMATTNPNSGKVFRVNNDGTGLATLTGVENPYAIGFCNGSALVTGGYRRDISLLDYDMTSSGTFTVPWGSLALDPDGNGNVGMITGIAVLPNGKGFFVSNEGGQTANERSTYGITDAQSGWLDGTFYTDLTHDDNDPILFASVPEPGSILALLAGLTGLGILKRRK